ncbi:nucleotidyltransferase family protein [[Mycobacterium] vasticus]|uniref:NTP transferase domain-containing protein n=1 Tax=[Mycobacterium] vasticus TaxID=2875777 RepID=A0ABU5Z2R5_9MYCO|nr:NTP transferase domain-containing protein [Mycolicibacter sp. MYC017]MEB3071696.1 NTP transferase domain-containing protein [Mycolicibacter sp. MYC017]
MSTRIIGLLLAAGAGRRYGQPKVLVDNWLYVAVDALFGGGCDEVAVLLGAAVVAVPSGASTVTVADWNQGLSASVRAGLAYAGQIAADYAVLHVVDTPDVGDAVVARVVQRAVASDSGLARACFAECPGHPVVIARRHWPAVMVGLTGDEGAGSYLRNASGLQLVECGDLASGRDFDSYR